MIDSQLAVRLQPLAAEAVSAGRRLLLPDGQRTSEVIDAVVEPDDFGVSAVVIVTVDSGETLRIATGSTVQVEAPEELPGVADEGSPEALIAHVAAVHPESPRVHELAERLTRGVNFKSGSNLQDIRNLALTLYVDLSDGASALKVCDLLTDQPFDGNFGRWNLIEGCLALAAHLTYDDGDTSRAEAYAASLRTADDAETDPLKAKLAAAVRQRQLNEPNLYDREIARAAGDPAVEKDWRVLRLSVLLYLRAHGGSETLGAESLDRRIGRELLAIRALNARLTTSG